MSVYVIDASVAAKWFFEEEYSGSALNIFHSDHILHAPDFILLEIDNVICKRGKSGEITDSEGEEVRTSMRLMPLRKHNLQLLMDTAFEIACLAGISIYDSLYIALAVRLDCPVVTADKRLYNAIRKTPFKENAMWIEELP